ncbi:MAG: hypothetical protein ACI4Q3_01390 [Kiritimatiellia bacterium]
MNADLEAALNGSEADLKAFVLSLRAAPQARTPPDFTARVMARVRGGRTRWLRPATLFPAAACLVALLAFGAIVFRPVPVFSLSGLMACQRPDGYFTSSPAAPYVQAFAVTVLAKDPAASGASLDQAVDALVRTQHASGGWADEQLSARNVAALAVASEAGVEAARDAYKRGLRFLRARGLNELSAAAFAKEARNVLARLSPTDDPGLACSVALCAEDHPIK